MGKNNNKKKGKNNRNEDYDYDKAQAMRQAGHTGKPRGDRPQHEKVEHPVARLLLDTISGQVLDVLSARNQVDLDAAVKNVFNLGYYPAYLEGCEGAQDYEAYQLERTARMDRADPTKLGRMTTTIVVLNRQTKKPAFTVIAFITPQRKSIVTVYSHTDKGTDYRNTIRWNYDGM